MDEDYTACWDPNSSSQVIQTHIDKVYGIILLVKQPAKLGGYEIISFNCNEQRLVYRASKEDLSNEEGKSEEIKNLSANWQIAIKFNDKLEKEERKHGQYVWGDTIDVLIKHMELQVQNPPQDQRYHWAEVSKPYGLLDLRRTVQGLDSQITRRTERNRGQ